MYSKIKVTRKEVKSVELYERIRDLRKNYLHLSQTEFGDKLGVSRSVIKNIELNALAKPDQKLSLLKLICKEFSVNEEWLMNGTEPMFIEPDTFSLDDFVKSHGATDLELEIIKMYFELDSSTRKTIVEHFRSRLMALPAVETPEPTTEDLEAEYKKSRLNSALKTESSASNIINGSGKAKEA